MTTTDLRDQAPGEASGRLIVGLDVPTIADAEKAVEELGDTVSFYKIGYQLVLRVVSISQKPCGGEEESLPRHEAA